MWKCKEQPIACSGITFLFRGAPVQHCMAEGKARLYQTGLNEHFFHHKPDTRQIPRVCGSLQEHQQCLGKEGKSREEREDTKHTQKRLQCMIKNYHRSLSYGVLQKERERDRG